MGKLYTSIEEVLACTRKIFWYMQDALLGLGATCFIVEYQKSFYVVTSRHGIHKADPNTIWIEKYPGARTSLPISELLSPTLADDLSGFEYADLAFLRVEMDLLETDDLAKIVAFSLDDRDTEGPYALHLGEIYLRGYPKTNSTIDYESCTIRTQAFLVEARYVGPSDNTWGLHEILLAHPELIETASGMSGSPVIQSIRLGNRLARIHLIGVLVRGSAASGVAHFIDADLVFGILKEIHNTPKGEGVLLQIIRENI